MASNPKGNYGKGRADGIAIGRAQKQAEIASQQRAAIAAHKAQQHANRVDVTAGAIGAVVAGLIPIAVQAVKDKRSEAAGTDA